MNAAKPRAKRALGGVPINARGGGKAKQGKSKDSGVVEARASSGVKAAKDRSPSKRSIRTGAGATGAGFDRGSKLRGGLRRPKGWKEQLASYYGEVFG